MNYRRYTGELWVLEGDLYEITHCTKTTDRGLIAHLRGLTRGDLTTCSIATLLGEGSNRITVRRNLNRRTKCDVWTIHNKTLGTVVGYLPHLSLNVEYVVVREYGRELLARSGKKTAHAGIVGQGESLPCFGHTRYEVAYNPLQGLFHSGSHILTGGDTVVFLETGKVYMS